MSDQKEEIPKSVMADKFIEVANEFTQTQSKECVSAAIMFAAARYSAFEITSKSKNLMTDKNDALNWFTAEYRRMLEANIDDLAQMLH